MAQLFNMRSTANVLVPLLYSAMYEYGLSINKPSFLYILHNQFICRINVAIHI